MNHVISSCVRATNRIMRPMGVRLTRSQNAKPNENGIESALDRLKRLHLPIQTIIDVGASNGCWSRKAQCYFPDVFILAFEPLEERWPELDQWKESDDHVRIVRGVAGACQGTIHFNVSDDLDGSGVSKGNEGGREIPVTSIDHEVSQTAVPAPFLIKLDTHGFEVPILEGASEALKQTQALIIEVYNFQLTDDALRFHEMCAHLIPLGFRCFDMFDIVRRADNTLWQADFVFLHETHPVFENTSYR